MTAEPNLLAEGDIEALINLDERCFPGEPFASSWWLKAAQQRGANAWVLQQGAELVGYALFSRVLDEAELLRIAVAPEARRQGLGALLLQHAEQALLAAGTVQLYLEVRASNTPAQALYQAQGWQLSGRRAGYYPAETGREDALLFSLCRGSVD